MNEREIEQQVKDMLEFFRRNAILLSIRERDALIAKCPSLKREIWKLWAGQMKSSSTK